MRRTVWPALWLASVTVGLGLVLAACNSVTTSGSTPSTGSLAITLNGLPGGVHGKVVVTGPSSYTNTVTSSTTLTGLPAGTYALAPDTVSNGTYPWSASSSQVSVQANATASTTVTYHESGGAIKVYFTGPLPSGHSYGATLKGNGVSIHVTAAYNNALTVTANVPNVLSGTYSVTPDTMPPSQCVLFADINYVGAAVPTSLTVGDNQTYTSTVTYVPLPGTC